MPYKPIRIPEDHMTRIDDVAGNWSAPSLPAEAVCDLLTRILAAVLRGELAA
jgi:hypothetical protein